MDDKYRISDELEVRLEKIRAKIAKKTLEVEEKQAERLELILIRNELENTQYWLHRCLDTEGHKMFHTVNQFCPCKEKIEKTKYNEMFDI